MDGDRFDGVARSVARVRLGRRAVGGAVAALLAAGAVETEAKKKRCPRAKKCGKDCCGGQKCFAKKVENIQGVETPTAYGCCPADKICRPEGATTGERDQCCYQDEVCRPNRDPNSSTGVCCRKCGTGASETCCENDERCDEKEGKCVDLLPPRYVRNRR
jgi:hypothetical protein